MNINKSVFNFDKYSLIFAASCAFLFVSFLEINYAFLIGIVGVPISLIIIIYTIRKINRLNVLRKILSFGGALLFMLSGPSGCYYSTWKTENTLAPVIAKLNIYHETHGVYPDNLNAIATNPVVCHDPKEKAFYIVSDSKDKFLLTCYTYGFNKHTYNSYTKKWNNWD